MCLLLYGYVNHRNPKVERVDIVQDLAIGASGNGSDLVTSYESDFMFHDDVKTWLPYPVQDTEGQFQTDAASAAEEYHGNELAYSFRNYELSARDRVVSEALPGYAGAHESSYMTDIAEGIVNYRWENGNIRNLFPYSSDNVVVNKVTDADGRGNLLETRLYNPSAITSYTYVNDRLMSMTCSSPDGQDLSEFTYDALGRMTYDGLTGQSVAYNDLDLKIIPILQTVRRSVHWTAAVRDLYTGDRSFTGLVMVEVH